MGRYLSPLRVHKHLMITSAVVIMVIATTLGMSVDDSFTATSTVTAKSGIAKAPNVNIDVEARRASSLAVNKQALRMLETAGYNTDLKSFEQGVEVEPNRTNKTLRFKFSANNAEMAQAGANALAESFVSYRSEQIPNDKSVILAAALPEPNRRLSLLQILIGSAILGILVGALLANLYALRAPPNFARNEPNKSDSKLDELKDDEIDNAAKSKSSLETRFEEFDFNEPELLDPALTKSQTQIKQLETRAGYWPLLKKLENLGKGRPVLTVSLGEPSGEAGLATSFGLADTLQAMGAEVLLVDLMTDDPMLNALVDVPLGPGLAELTRSEVKADQVVLRLEGLERISVIPAGHVDSTQPYISAETIITALKPIIGNYHITILIAGTALEATCKQELIAASDGVIVGVSDQPGSTLDEELIDSLVSLPAPTLGVISADAVAASI